MLPEGKQPGLLLSHVLFAGGEVLQKYYKVTVLVGDATVSREVTVASGSQRSISTSSSSAQSLEVMFVEELTRHVNTIIKINSLVDLNKMRDSFSLTFWTVILTIVLIILGFGICMLIAAMDEYRPEGQIYVLAVNALSVTNAVNKDDTVLLYLQ